MSSLSSLRSQASSLLAQYVDPDSGYSFTTYDLTPQNQSGYLQPEDVLAANLLSLRLGAPQVIPLFAATPGPAPALLQAMNVALHDLSLVECSFEDLDSLEDLDRVMEPLAAANRATRTVPEWTPVTVSKVLHRHLPHLVPIVDSRVRAFYDIRPGQEQALRHALWEDIRANREWLTEAAGNHPRPDGQPMSLLRAADIVIWMSGDAWRASAS